MRVVVGKTRVDDNMSHTGETPVPRLRMKQRALYLILSFAILPLSVWIAGAGQEAEPQPIRYSQFALSPYNQYRAGYETLPVQVLGLRGGRLSAREKFKIEVLRLKNTTSKRIVGIKFSSFIFSAGDLNTLLEAEQTALVPLDLPPLEQGKFEILVLYVDSIPLLAYKPGREFRLEVAATEVHYDDGSIWQARDLPGKLDLSKRQ